MLDDLEIARSEESIASLLAQVENGVAVRMAVLYLVLGGESAARSEGRA